MWQGAGCAGNEGGKAGLDCRRCEGGGLPHYDMPFLLPSLSCTLPLFLVPLGRAVSGAQLTPADVEVGDIVEAARDGAQQGSSRRIDFVVREVQARLGAWLHR